MQTWASRACRAFPPFPAPTLFLETPRLFSRHDEDNTLNTIPLQRRKGATETDHSGARFLRGSDPVTLLERKYDLPLFVSLRLTGQGNAVLVPPLRQVAPRNLAGLWESASVAKGSRSVCESSQAPSPLGLVGAEKQRMSTLWGFLGALPGRMM